ncbi:MAG: methyltransferase, TrmH family [Gaiellaceae bacterium]|nr:methyltransferase, TrmH family [Gaiellaceae bacterium]
MITSASNPKLKLIKRLLDSRRQREKEGLFAVEGEDLVEAARDADIEPVELLFAGEDVEPGLLAAISTLAHPPRVIGVYRKADLPVGATPLALALWHVGDPGNVGTLMRTADAFAASVALSAGCADPTSPKALRASAGAIFRVNTSRFDDAARPWIALTAHGGESLHQIELGLEASFVLGAERDGLPDDVVARCDARATIALEGPAESLNVAMAGAVALYEFRRRLL